ncbi:hypothetical protein Hdeb2414_s0006g00217131 [Helianthus debilis subsp. tardiflorus]
MRWMMTMLKCYPQSGQKTLMSVEKPGVHDDMLDDLVFIEELSIVDFKQLEKLMSYSEKRVISVGLSCKKLGI